MASVIERTIEGGAGFFTANLLKRGFGFLFIVVAGRFMGPAEFGVLSLGLSVTGVARNLAAFGLSNTIQRFPSEEGEERSAQIYSAILLTGGGQEPCRLWGYISQLPGFPYLSLMSPRLMARSESFR